MSLADKAEKTPELLRMLLDTAIPNTHIAEKFDCGEASVRRWRAKNGVVPQTASETTTVTPDIPATSPQVTIQGDSGYIYTGPLPEPITDATGWRPLLLMLGVGDPENWLVIDDTVKVSTWQQSKRTENGDRDLVLLYAYSARIRRVSAEEALADAALDEIAKRVKVRKAGKRSIKGQRPPVWFVWQQGDEQTGKAEGGGLDGLYEREADALQAGWERLDWFITKGYNVQGILDSAQGDRMENIFGHYPSQSRTTDTFRKQVGFAVEMDVWRTEMFAEFRLPIKKVYTPSNHGEIRQVIGQQPYTSESDNLDLMIGELVRNVIDRLPDVSELVEWHIPHDEWLTMVPLEVGGDTVNIGVTHGHKADGKGNLQTWIKNQIHYWERHHKFPMDLMLLGHRHHFYAEQLHGTTIIQTPSLDGGSPYFAAGYGEHAEHGVATFLVDPRKPLKFDNLTVL